MKFIHNKIMNPAGTGPSFNEWLEKLASQINQERTASEAKPGLGMSDSDKDPRGSDRGQVINNDNEDGAKSYQEGESVDGKKDQGGNSRSDKGGKTDQSNNEQTDKEASGFCFDCKKPKDKCVCEEKADKEAACGCPQCKKSKKDCKCASAEKTADCGKEMGESSDAGKVTEEHTEAAPGDPNNKDCKQLINNDPNYQKGESVDPSKATGKGKKGPGDDVVGKGKKSSVNSKFQRVASADRLTKLRLFAAISSQKSYHLGLHPLDYTEAMVGLTFANMTDEEKSWFKDFWTTQYGEDYVELMVKDR